MIDISRTGQEGLTQCELEARQNTSTCDVTSLIMCLRFSLLILSPSSSSHVWTAEVVTPVDLLRRSTEVLAVWTLAVLR